MTDETECLGDYCENPCNNGDRCTKNDEPVIIGMDVGTEPAKTVVIIGAGAGLGSSIARALSDKDLQVIIDDPILYDLGRRDDVAELAKIHDVRPQAGHHRPNRKKGRNRRKY